MRHSIPASGVAHIRARAIDFDRRRLLESQLFDPAWYVAKAGYDAHGDPLAHYLQTGWLSGFEPNSTFPGTLLYPYFASIGLDGPPAITWLLLRDAGWPVYCDLADIERSAAAVTATGLFRADFYRSQLSPEAALLSPAIHYVTVGERYGFAPSPEFNPNYYGDRNPDVRDAHMTYLLHYAEFGRAEGRHGTPLDVLENGLQSFDPAKPNVILVIHDTTRTGAPILGWNLATRLHRKYNLFTVRLGDGELTDEYRKVSVELLGPFHHSRLCSVDVEYGLRPLLESRNYLYAIVNSVASQLAIEPCVRRFIPTVLLVHEFASYMGSAASLATCIDWTSEVVYSAHVVAQSSEEVHPNMKTRSVRIIPQGLTVLPPGGCALGAIEPAAGVLAKLEERRKQEEVFIVLGCGYVQFRKGVDLFLATAAAVQKLSPQRPVHFLWVGDGYNPKEDLNYSIYLQEQIDRSHLRDCITFLGVVSDVEPAYRISDAFFLSSRLDPLPNAAMDAFEAGIPVFSFRNSSGIADLMQADPICSYGVVDYLDTDSVANKIVAISNDGALWQRLSQAMTQLSRRYFNMDCYLDRLDQLGNQAHVQMHQRRVDASTLASDSSFDQELFLGPTTTVESRDATIVRYLALAAARGWKSLPIQDDYLRRPCPGFNPGVYASHHPECSHGHIDPLASFIRSGRPAGPWQLEVLRPDDEWTSASEQLKVAVHLHVMRPALCRAFVKALMANQSHFDLFVTAEDPSSLNSIRAEFTGFAQGEVDFRAVEARGSDTGALLTALRSDLAGYDIIGHFHMECRSWYGEGVTDAYSGNTWREFLWQHLVGERHPMLDRVVSAFETDPALGLVFPCDGNLVGWLGSLEIAEGIAARIGQNESLPEMFDFPIGNMYWIRRRGLQPLLDLNLSWNDYPEEPSLCGGTILDALDRLTPFAVQASRLKLAVTHVPDFTWAPPRLARPGW